MVKGLENLRLHHNLNLFDEPGKMSGNLGLSKNLSSTLGTMWYRDIPRVTQESDIWL